MTVTSIVIVSVLMQALPASLDSYRAFLQPTELARTCRLDDPSFFRNLTYQFRSRAGGEYAVALKDGRYDVVEPPYGVEWAFELEAVDAVSLSGSSAVLLRIFQDHRRGSGSWTHLLVARCASGRTQVVFEATGEGARATFTGDSLVVTHPVWAPNDSHAGPSTLIEEVYRWSGDPRRFVLTATRRRSTKGQPEE